MMIQGTAQTAFRDASDGRRLFYRGGPFSRPYIVPDSVVEMRLLGKRVWMMRLLVAFLALQPLIMVVFPRISRDALWFAIYVVLTGILFWLVGHLLLSKELRKLEQLESPVPLTEYFGAVAKGNSARRLVLSCLFTLTLVFAGAWMFYASYMRPLSLAILLLAISSSAGLIYTLWLKRRPPST